MMNTALLSIITILLWSVTNTNSRHLPDDSIVDRDLVNSLIKQPYNKHRIFLPKITENWKESSFNPDRWIDSDFEEMWQRNGSPGGTISDKDEFLKYVLIKRIETILFEGWDNFFLRLAWEETLREKTGNCYADKECRPHLVRLTINKVCRTLEHIAVLQQVKFGFKLTIKTVIRILKCLAHPGGTLADVAQVGIEYYEHEIIGKVVGVAGNMLLAALTSEIPPDAAAGMAFILWCISEAVRWATEMFLA